MGSEADAARIQFVVVTCAYRGLPTDPSRFVRYRAMTCQLRLEDFPVREQDQRGDDMFF